MKALITSLVLVGAPAVFAFESPSSFDEVVIDEAELIEIQVENSSDLSDSQLLAELAVVIQSDDAYKGKVVNLTVGTSSDTLNFSLMKPMVETIGQKETIKPSEFARDVGAMIGSAVGGVHGSASATVKYKESEKKPDGSEKTKSVEVTITVSGGKK